MSKKINLLILLLVITAGTTHAQGSLAAAEQKMFTSIVRHDPVYLRDDVSPDFFSINADGTTQNKTQLIADSAAGKFMSAFTYKTTDKVIRELGNIGIITGKVQAFMNDKLAVIFLYTATFKKENGKWLYLGWQGTVSKDSPPPPPLPGR